MFTGIYFCEHKLHFSGINAQECNYQVVWNCWRFRTLSFKILGLFTFVVLEQREIQIYVIFSLDNVCLVAQSCPSLCNTMDCSPPGSSVREIFQARILERIAISFSRASSRPRNWTCVLCIGRQSLYHQRHMLLAAARSLQTCPTFLQPYGLQPARLLYPWDSPWNTGVGCHTLLQGIFPTQGLNLCFLFYCIGRWILYH